MTMTMRSYVLQLSLAGLSVIAALWIATQWAASMLAYQPALGAAWTAVLGWPVYAPWQLIPWWLAFDAQAQPFSHAPVPLQPSGAC